MLKDILYIQIWSQTHNKACIDNGTTANELEARQQRVHDEGQSGN